MDSIFYNANQVNNTNDLMLNDESDYYFSTPNISLNGKHSTDYNDTTNDTNINQFLAKADIINDGLIQGLFCLFYVIILVLGLFGNVLVCYVVLRNKAMRTVTNLFIANLALADILMCSLAVPFTPLYTFLRRWVFGAILCSLVASAQACSVYISTLTLTSIAIDRYFVIIFPFHPRMKLWTCTIIILIIWITSVILTVPYGLFMDHYHIDNKTHFYCEETWPFEEYRKAYGTLTMVLQFVIPFVVISFCYVCVSLRLNDRAKAKPGTKTTKKDEVDRDRKKRTNRMLIAMVMVFGISWLPLNVVNILNDYYATMNDSKYYNVIFFIAHSIAMSSTCYNPVLYAWMNDNFRKEFKLVLPCFSASRMRRKSMTGSQRWQPEPTYNGNNETLQESLLTSSFTKSTFHSYGQRESIQLNGLKNSNSFPEQSILLSDIGQVHQVKNRNIPETVTHPSGVLETNFEEPNEVNLTPKVMPTTSTNCNKTHHRINKKRTGFQHKKEKRTVILINDDNETNRNAEV